MQGNGNNIMAGNLSVVTVGTFDGVHCGHRVVLDYVRQLAREEGLQPIAVTFDRHPLEIVAPERAPGLIMSADERDVAIAGTGVRPIRVKFDASTRSTTVAGWMRRLHDDFGARIIVLGYDNTFGCDGLEMTVADYRRIASRLGMRLEVAPVEEGCSSSAIRKALKQGNIPVAAELLGRRFTIQGRVVKGARLGRSIGVPTANLDTPPTRLLPGPGVYKGRVTIEGKTYKAVVNIGPKPTVDNSGRNGVEAHILGFDGDLYGQTLTLTLEKRLRDIRRFESLEALKAQIALDIAEAEG